ncbi:DUF2291 family protein [candidate division KSB1 bacterium]|nr:DUF2291 family protein [candidate division KSB1 bacterium]
MQTQKKKYIGILFISCLLVIALYHSVYFENLDAKKEGEKVKDLNPADKVDYFWSSKLDQVLPSAIDLKLFDSQLADDPASLMRQYGKAVGITSTFSFLVKYHAKQVTPGAEKIPVALADGYTNYYLQTKYIFGNAARDATGYFDIDEFENTMAFNAIATELNKLISTRVITKLDSLSPGEMITFIGALEINSENIPRQIGIVPLQIAAVH